MRPAYFASLAALLAAIPLPQLAGARSPADPSGKPARSCFWADAVNGFAAADDRTLNVRVGVRDVYQFEMFGPCRDIRWTERLALVSRGGSNICTGLDAEIIAPSPIGPQRCQVRAVRKLTPAEVAALPKGARP
ncbi:DUF6491 family protein [Phenylobacterium sp.]|jgi:hypothetical protein|uniref:DUF6491 family protein n=1 Tax=Phenylobacterium sp. TaxID=1871053 RepID=UPI003784BC69